MLHYAVNRPLGALMGESDLVTLLPWLQRYSRMLEDRVRLYWAVRAFLWVVTVPANKIKEKQDQYRHPPFAPLAARALRLVLKFAPEIRRDKSQANFLPRTPSPRRPLLNPKCWRTVLYSSRSNNLRTDQLLGMQALISLESM